MIEYLHNAIRAVAGQEAEVQAFFANTDGSFMSENVAFMLHGPDGEMIAAVEGNFNAETGQWTFNVPAEATKGRKGRHWYCFQHNHTNLCFLQPYYLM